METNVITFSVSDPAVQPARALHGDQARRHRRQRLLRHREPGPAREGPARGQRGCIERRAVHRRRDCAGGAGGVARAAATCVCVGGQCCCCRSHSQSAGSSGHPGRRRHFSYDMYGARSLGSFSPVRSPITSDELDGRNEALNTCNTLRTLGYLE